MTPRPPWERMDGESTRAYAAFTSYRDLPPNSRSLRAAAESSASGRANLRQYERWSGQWEWVSRVEAHDAFMDGERRTAERDAIVDMGRQHAAAAMQLVERGVTALAAVELAALRFIESGIKLERLARGEPEERIPADAERESPQDRIRELLSSDPAVAKAAAMLGAQILRAKRERERNGK
jgi:hypothetical protein